MSTPEKRVALDHETVYRLTAEQQWAEVLDLVHEHHATVTQDALLERAVETFVSAFVEALEAAEDNAFRDELETLFLLHTGRLYRLPVPSFERVVECLVALHADCPEAALGYARFCPDNERCAAVIQRYGEAEATRVAHEREDVLDVSVSTAREEADATISLFKSQQEADFFRAMREVFATYFVYPNVALSCLVDYEQIRDQLTDLERRYFFRGIVDCVVFDQHGGYRPRYFFELDSAFHDIEAQQTRDRYKDRILALAGQKLYRIRRRSGDEGRRGFVQLLKEIAPQLES